MPKRTNQRPFIYQETQADKAAFMRRGDAWATSEDYLTLAVADSPLRRLTIAKRAYPFDDLGGHFAHLFCNKFVEYAERLHKDSSVSEIRDVLVKINSDIRLENVGLGRVYGDNNNYDMGEVVGAGLTIKGNRLLYGLLEDCYINVLRGEDLHDQVKINYQIVKSSKQIDGMRSKGRLTEFMSDELREVLQESDYWEPMWCTYLRNNTTVTDSNGEKVGWGIFNGQQEAEHFFQVGEVALEPGDHILIFTDGMIPILEDRDTLKWLLEHASPTFNGHYRFRQQIEKLLKGKSALYKEKTLIYLRWEG